MLVADMAQEDSGWSPLRGGRKREIWVVSLAAHLREVRQLC